MWENVSPGLLWLVAEVVLPRNGTPLFMVHREKDSRSSFSLEGYKQVISSED